MSSNPCAVYNFYNCCECNGSSAADPTVAFIWQSGNILDPRGATTSATVEPLTPGFAIGNSPNAALMAYQGLMPLHRKARLKEISLIRFAELGPPYTASIDFDLIVLDVNGVFITQLSTATLNYQTIPLKTWTPITLSAVAGALDVLPGQVIAGRLKFGAPASSLGFAAIYQLSGTGVLIP